MMLAHRERLVPKATQARAVPPPDQGRAVKAPLPAPGVFARHNAVDTPALLPDGTPSELSVSRVLTARGQIRPVSLVSDDVAVLVSELNARWGAALPRRPDRRGRRRADRRGRPAGRYGSRPDRAVGGTTGDTVLERERS